MRRWRDRGLVLRGLWERRGLSLAVLVVAIIPVVAAATGPVFSAAAGTALARTALRDAGPDGRGWRLSSMQGDVADAAARLVEGVPFVHPPIHGMELLGPEVPSRRNRLLMWQEGQCEHLTVVAGRCPERAREIMVSEASGLRLGREVRLTVLLDSATEPDAEPRLARLRVVGVYRPTDITDPFWFGRNLFPESAGFHEGNGDPLFTVPQTAREVALPANIRWTHSAIVFIDPDRITSADLGTLEELQARAERPAPGEPDFLLQTRVPAVLGELRAQREAFGVPTFLVIAQLVGLGWLLLYLTVADLVTARGPEIALARLRGHGRLRVWRFALAEPLFLLAVALAAGLALSTLTAEMLADRLLTMDVPITLPASAVAAGAAVPLGGLAAAAVAAWRMAVRPITEELRRTPRRKAPGWVIDAVILAVTGLGLVELLATGLITETSGQRSGALAVPGLLAVAGALLAGRVVPLAVRSLFALTRRRGGIGPFLALRQVARGPATRGNLIVLGTAFGMAAFATAAWSVTAANFDRVAKVHNGADTVLRLRPGDVATFREAVERADPSGRYAAPVVIVPGQPKLLATDTVRFAQVAHWDPAWAGASLTELTARLRVPVAPRITLTGDRIRLRLRPVDLPSTWRARLFADFRVPGDSRPRAVPLGSPEHRVLEWGLPIECHHAVCELRALRNQVTVGGMVTPDDQARYEYRIERIEVRSGGRWRELDAGLTEPARWRGTGTATGRGLLLPLPWYGESRVEPATFPERLPVLANGPIRPFLPGLSQDYKVRGEAVATAAALPGLDDFGVVVDLDLADRAAYQVSPDAEFQVWVAPGRLETVRAGLAAQGFPIFSPRRPADLITGYTAQGPGLALMLLFLSALAAAALALGRTVLALYTAARRRGYELTALAATGARTGALRAALLLEQSITLGAGLVAGVVTGALAAWVALPRIPAFTRPPITPPLSYEPQLLPMAAVLGAALLAALVAAVLTVELLLRGIRTERLRQAY